ncbi:MAG: hypothetical protein ACLFTW_14635, partial [Chitinispirillaceae bacterium]
MLCCSDSIVSSFDDGYKGDYSAQLDIEQNQLFAFVPFTVAITNTGKDEYLSFSIQDDVKELDSKNSYCSSKPDAQLYFKAPYRGTVRVLGRRHNGDTDTFNIEVDVKNPFFLHKSTLENDSVSFRISIPEKAQEATGSIHEARWFVNGRTVGKTSGDKPHRLIARSSDTVEVVCVDWYGNRLTLSDASEGSGITNVDYSRFISTTEKLSLDVELSSFEGDTGTLYSVIGPDTATLGMNFTDTNQTASIQMKNSLDSPGEYSTKVFYRSVLTGYQSNEVEFQITASEKPYFAQYSQKPSQPLCAGETYNWTVETCKKDGSPISSPGRYFWLAIMDGDTLFESKKDTLKSLSLRIPREGELIVSSYFQDINLNKSSTATDTLTVIDSALGTAGDIAVTPWPIHTGQTATFVLPVPLSEENSTAISYWSFDGDTLWEKTTSGISANRVFKSPGKVLLNARYQNSISSYHYSCSLTVLDGSPEISNVSVENHDLYSSSPLSVNVDARVPFGSIRGYIATVKSGDRQKTVSSPLAPLEITTGIAGPCTLSVSVIGPGHDTVTYDNTVPLEIEDGSPVIDSVIGDSVFIPEDFTLKVAASDIDGNLSRMIIDWSDGVVDTMPLSGSRATISASHKYDAVPNDEETIVSVTAEDLPGLQSETFEKRIHITDIRPKPLLNNSDTLWFTTGPHDYPDSLKTIINQDTLIIPERFLSLNPEYFDNFISFSASSPENNEVNLFAYSFDTTLEGSALNWTNDSCFRPQFADDLYSKLRSSP